ncbi:MAG: LysR family transcriptional regulator [Pseudomonadota bacterium]
MRLDKVDLNLFVALDVIYTEQNLTRAAEILGVTQPAVSNALARLRATLNDELFVRTPKGMAPTPLTENIIPGVRDALQLLNASVRAADRFDPKKTKRMFRLSLNDVAEALFLPRLMHDLNIHAPGASVVSYYERRSELSLSMSSGKLDIAIDVPAAVDKDMHHHPLFKEQYVCAVRENHPDVHGDLTLEQYLDLEHIEVSSRKSGLGLVDHQLRKLGYERRVRLRLSHYLVVPEIVLNTNLALTVPSHWVRWTGMKTFELPFKVPELETHLIWHQSADGDLANRWLRERILALGQELQAGQP